jgi:hypothetical protein
MTLGEFLAWEERQPTRHEFDGFQPVAMTGGAATLALPSAVPQSHGRTLVRFTALAQGVAVL